MSQLWDKEERRVVLWTQAQCHNPGGYPAVSVEVEAI